MDDRVVSFQSNRLALNQPISGTVEIWAIFAFLAEKGFSLDQFLRNSGLEADLLLDPAARLSLAAQIRIQRAAIDARIPALFVQVGRRLHLSTFGVPGFAILSSPSLGAALNTMVRFAPLLGFKMPLTIQRGPQIRLVLQPSPDLDRQVAAQLLALDLAKLLTFLRDLLGPTSTPRSVSEFGLDPDARRGIGEYYGSEVSDSASETPESVVCLDASLSDRPLLQSHAITHRKAVEDCADIMADFRSQMDLRLLILERMRQLEIAVPSSAQVATDLGMSDRTLRRRLEKVGTSFSNILDEHRKQLAQLYLREGMTTEGIAERLGYSDAANFRCAFKRWTGMATSKFKSASVAEGDRDRTSMNLALANVVRFQPSAARTVLLAAVGGG